VNGCCEGAQRFAFVRHSAAGECCGFERRFKSRDEKVSGLEEYLKDLEAEAAAVREAIADIKP
jgi:hypothetical protein